MAAWWQGPITQAHGENDEQGVDLGTPFHTPLTEILGGTVQAVNCGVGWGCEIDVSTIFQGQPYIEGYLHVDQPLVSPGQALSPGQQVGLSGGEITALPGAQHIDSPEFSSGPHVEYDLWRGNSPWQNAIDPTGVVQAGPVGAGGPSGGQLPGPVQSIISILTGGAGAVAAQTPASQLPGLNIVLDPFGNLGQQIGSSFSGFGNWIHDRAVPFAGANVIALAVAAAVILVLLGTGQERSSPMPIPVPV
jgi:murein DD-endopeptidase MepM/ murein hydrolase activator NlpD